MNGEKVRNKKSGGFTLVEVVVVAVIVAILAAAAVPVYRGFMSDSRCRAVQNWAATTSAEAAHYQSEYGTAPNWTVINCAPSADIQSWINTTITPSSAIANPTNITASSDKCGACNVPSIAW